jgi:solute:Na+ symporter, SSS family
MFGLTIPDLLVIVAYFAVLVLIGFRSMKKIRNQEDFFLGGRRFGKLIQVFAAFGQATSADTGPSVATTTATNGAAGIWSALMMLFSTPSYWFTAVWYRRMRLLSLGDFFSERYASRWLGGVYAVMASVSLVLVLTVGFIAMSKTVLVMTPKSSRELNARELQEYSKALRLEELESADYSILTADQRHELTDLRILAPEKNFSHIDRFTLIMVMVVIVCLYSISGGLEAAFISDMMQGVFIILLSVILIPFSFIRINREYGTEGMMGAFRVMHEQLPESFFEVFGSPHSMDFTWYYILALGIMATINVAVGANQLVATGSARNEHAARVGLTYGTYLKRITTVFWGLTALAAILLFADRVSDPDMLWGYASRELLGPLNMGLIGLMIAALMAALMSTADMMMITASGLITSAVYLPLFPGRSERHYVTIGRIFGVLVVLAAVGMVMSSDNLFGRLKLLWEFGVIYSAGFWMGVLWRKTNRKAVWASILTTFTLFFLLPALGPAIIPGIRTEGFLLKQTRERVEERTYTAHHSDVLQRNKEITAWHEQNRKGTATGQAPSAIAEGEKFVRTYAIPGRSIFWAGGVSKASDGNLRGEGLLSLELVFYDFLGMDLAGNSYALNETLRIITRTLVPFLIIIIVSLLSRHTPREEEVLDRFYVRMKTPVAETPEKDRQEVEASYADVTRFDHTKLFPRTNWQFTRWDRTDTVGFVFALLMVGLVLLLLLLMVNLGGKIDF